MGQLRELPLKNESDLRGHKVYLDQLKSQPTIRSSLWPRFPRHWPVPGTCTTEIFVCLLRWYGSDWSSTRCTIGQQRRISVRVQPSTRPARRATTISSCRIWEFSRIDKDNSQFDEFNRYWNGLAPSRLYTRLRRSPRKASLLSEIILSPNGLENWIAKSPLPNPPNSYPLPEAQRLPSSPTRIKRFQTSSHTRLRNPFVRQ